MVFKVLFFTQHGLRADFQSGEEFLLSFWDGGENKLFKELDQTYRMLPDIDVLISKII